MNHDTQQLPSEINPDVEMVEVVQGVPVITFSSSDVTQTPKSESILKDNSENIKPGTSNTETSTIPKILTFQVHYLNTVYKINISELCTLSKWQT